MARRVERFAKRETGVHRQEWIWRKSAKLDRVAASKLKRGVTGSPKLKCRHRMAAKVVVPAGTIPNQLVAFTWGGIEGLRIGQSIVSELRRNEQQRHKGEQPLRTNASASHLISDRA